MQQRRRRAGALPAPCLAKYLMWFSKRKRSRTRDELSFHRDQLTDDYVARGMDRQEAERCAFLQFGNVAVIEEASRDVRGRWLEDLTRDIAYALRALRRSPGFAGVAVLSLALGIGANAAIFSLINAVLLRPLPVTEPDRLVQITRVTNRGRPANASYPLFEYLRDNVRSISGAFVQQTVDLPISMDGQSEFVSADLVSGAYYAVLGIQPAVGQLLGPDDDVLSPASPAAVVSDRYWQRRFARSPSAIGKPLLIRDRVFTIVGVAPASYQGAKVGTAPDVVLPLMTMMNQGQRQEVTNNSLSLLARLKPGVTVEQADAEVQVLWRAFLQPQAERAPEKDRADILRQRAGVFSAPGGFNPFRADFQQPLVILIGIVAIILLLACVNLSGLLLARGAARQREISIRLAIGAGRARLVRQFLTETLVLTSVGGGLGLVMAYWFSSKLFLLFADGRSVVLSVTPDWRVVAFTCGLSLVTAVVAGLAPALQAFRASLNLSLKQVRAAGQPRLGKSLVVAQLAISMVLVIAGTLFVGTLIRLYAVERGFDSDGLLVTYVRANRPYPAARAQEVQAALVRGLQTLPGVEAATAVSTLPLSGNLWRRNVQVEGYAFRSDESDMVDFNVIAPGYFTTLRTPVLVGREFSARDTGTAPKVAVVNESFARSFFGDQSALGRHVTSVNVTYEIVGVVGDAKYDSLRDSVRKTMYVAWTQREDGQPSNYKYLSRVATGDPSRLAPLVERLVRETDAALGVQTATTYARVIGRNIAAERILAMLGGLCGLLGIVVAGIGMFGVLAFQVARRTNELGVRMALGANRWSIMRLVLRDVVLMLVPGVAIGIAVASFAAGITRSIVFGFAPTDPAVFIVSASVLASAALVAGWLPARRASRVDPLIALRHE